MFNKLTGLKLEISFLSSFPLSNGTTVATSWLSGNTLFSILEFVAVATIGAIYHFDEFRVNRIYTYNLFSVDFI